MSNTLRKLYYCLRNLPLFLPYLKKFLFKPKNGGYLWEVKHKLYEIEVVDYLKKVLKEGDTFIDVGANVGYYENICSPLVGSTGEIYAFEPISVIFRASHKNSYNKISNVRLVALACGSRNGRAKLNIAGDLGDGSSLVKEFLDYNKAEIKKEVEVEVIRLDKYIKDHRVENIKAIKIDTEMYDFEVLKGLSGYFDTGARPIVVCEVQDKKAYKEVLGQDIRELIDYMRFYGYEAYSIYLPNKKVNLLNPITIGNVIFKINDK